MSERYQQLKEMYHTEIMGDGNADRVAVERRITRLRDDFFEKEERLLQSVKDMKADQDPQLLERAKGRLQEEKAALDDAILDALENQKAKLPVLDEAAHTARKVLDVPQRQTSIIPAVIRASVKVIVACVLAPLLVLIPYLLMSDIDPGLRAAGGPSVKGFISFVGTPIVSYCTRLMSLQPTGIDLGFTLLGLFGLVRVWLAAYEGSQKNGK